MDDLGDDPIKVAKDIIDQGTKGLKFAKEAENRIVNILNAYRVYQQLDLQQKQEIEELKAKIRAEAEIIVEGGVCWKVLNGEKKVPYCCRCWSTNKVLMPMRDNRNGIHTCIECNNSWDDGTYRESEDEGGGSVWGDRKW